MLRSSVIILFLLIAFSVKAQYKLYSDGLEKYNQKDFIGSIELLSDFLTRPVRDKKFDVDAYYWRGLASFKVNEFESAVEDLNQALQLKHPNQGNIHWFIAKANHALQRYPQAIESFTTAMQFFVKDDVKKSQLLSDRAESYIKSGNATEAKNDLNQSLKLQPGIQTVQSRLRDLDGTNTVVVTEVKKNDPQPSVAPQPTTISKPISTDQPVVERSSHSVEQKPIVTTPPVVVPVVEEPTLEELYKNEKRFALVIGNSNYTQKVGPLRNPMNDATDFATTLRALDFDVTLITDATYGKIRAEMIKFREKLNQGEKDQTVGLFYYAGHGLQHDNENYIVPVDAELEFEDDIPRYCFPIQKMVLTQLEQTNSRMNIIVLDACRNNPFPSMNRGIGENQGLGEMKKARGAYIAYATSPGSVASDGTGKNGLYTQELIKAMQRPGRTIEQVFKEVRANVLKLSGDRQNPWENSNIIGDFYFKFK